MLKRGHAPKRSCEEVSTCDAVLDHIKSKNFHVKGLFYTDGQFRLIAASIPAPDATWQKKGLMLWKVWILWCDKVVLGK